VSAVADHFSSLNYCACSTAGRRDPQAQPLLLPWGVFSPMRLMAVSCSLLVANPLKRETEVVVCFMSRHGAMHSSVIDFDFTPLQARAFLIQI